VTQAPARRRFIGPFNARQVVGAVLVVVITGVVLTLATTPLGPVSPVGLPSPRASAFQIGPPVEGLAVGQAAPELEASLDDGTTFRLTDLEGDPLRLADFRGKVVWVNFWATWCPPCQQETPVLRDVSEAYAERDVILVAINVQETAERAREYAEQYDLRYVIGADVSAHILHRYRVFALPTQFFIDPGGVIRAVVQGPLDAATARTYLDALVAKPSPPPAKPSPQPAS
jgi:thiol-disulfide isomerase/thioredoxin